VKVVWSAAGAASSPSWNKPGSFRDTAMTVWNSMPLRRFVKTVPKVSGKRSTS
jgi:hypothetical protein